MRAGLKPDLRHADSDVDDSDPSIKLRDMSAVRQQRNPYVLPPLLSTAPACAISKMLCRTGNG